MVFPPSWHRRRREPLAEPGLGSSIESAANEPEPSADPRSRRALLTAGAAAMGAAAAASLVSVFPAEATGGNVTLGAANTETTPTSIKNTASSASATAFVGESTGAGATAVQGLADGSNGVGVAGVANTGSGAVGVKGNSLHGIGVFGSGVHGVYATGTYDAVYAISTSGNGINANGKAYGVQATGTTGGVHGISTAGNGVYGEGDIGVFANATYSGVYGVGDSYGGVFYGGPTGVYTSGDTTGVRALGGTNGIIASGGTYGVTGDGIYGVSGTGTIGVQGSSNVGSGYGLYGLSTNGGTSYGVVGVGTGYRGVYGQGPNAGVYATSSQVGVWAESTGAYGIYAHTTGVYGIWGAGAADGVVGIANGGGADYGVNGQSDYRGVYGSGPNAGTYGTSPYVGIWGQVSGSSTATTYGVYGDNTLAAGYAVYANGRLHASSYASGPAAQVIIDHPSDPANRFLAHAHVASPDMLNVYSGTVTLGKRGTATVVLPSYLEAANRDFRYQLTAIGSAAPGLHVATEVANGRFGIAGGSPGQRVSWHITGVRNDAWANANRLRADALKPKAVRGKYLNPEVHGQPASASMHAMRGVLPAHKLAKPPVDSIATRPAILMPHADKTPDAPKPPHSH